MHALRQATRMLFDADEGAFAEQLNKVETRFADCDPVRKIVAFLRECGQRPLCWPRDRAPE